MQRGISNKRNIFIFGNGFTRIVKITQFEEKQLDINITVNYGGMVDSCLGVASRWGYYDIVELLLKCGRIKFKNAEEVYNDEGIKIEIRNLIKSYIFL